MPAGSPEEICRLFKQYMAASDIESLRTIYDPQVTFLNQSRKEKKGWQELKAELAPLAAAKTIFEYDIRQIIHSDDIALMHTRWKVQSLQPMSQYAIEVARWQSGGTWR